MGHILKHHIKPTSSLLKKNMDFDYYNNVENLNYGFVNINSVDINLNEVSDHSDFSDTEVVPTYFDFESSMNIEDMMSALEEDIIISDEPIPDNDNSFANFEDKVEDICNTIENNDFDQEYQPESPKSCTSDEDFNSTSSDEDYEPDEPQKKSQPKKRISKQPMKNTTLPNQKLKNRLKNDEFNVVKPQILHIGCSLCSMKIQAPLDGHTIPMVNSRFWTRKNWPKCGAKGRAIKE